MDLALHAWHSSLHYMEEFYVYFPGPVGWNGRSRPDICSTLSGRPSSNYYLEAEGHNVIFKNMTSMECLDMIHDNFLSYSLAYLSVLVTIICLLCFWVLSHYCLYVRPQQRLQEQSFKTALELMKQHQETEVMFSSHRRSIMDRDQQTMALLQRLLPSTTTSVQLPSLYLQSPEEAEEEVMSRVRRYLRRRRNSGRSVACTDHEEYEDSCGQPKYPDMEQVFLEALIHQGRRRRRAYERGFVPRKRHSYLPFRWNQVENGEESGDEAWDSYDEEEEDGAHTPSSPSSISIVSDEPEDRRTQASSKKDVTGAYPFQSLRMHSLLRALHPTEE